ncbi:hypothetical protein LVD15_15315 [Fulvivirga maritima]|uniref:hypothetical protein n=1 Tax=Fulvivirga maritima TaxID=2904247 RepID=UPI001F3B5C85|nr:hypothetical protein [Fulvivirga maritima]UII24683.1 hypothetical protein LVD15_15315 [Fulvivirga maritima]
MNSEPITTIPKELPQDSALSYNFLRSEGIKHIQRLAGHIWTDHNAHDPGITILEQLCYAITDLSYRIDHDIKDLLGTNEQSTYKDLYSPATILTTKPVTILDIRKVVIDVSGVKNAWVEKVSPKIAIPDFNEITETAEGEQSESEVVLKGLYRIVFEKEESAASSTVLNDVKTRLQACRGACEDYHEISLLNTQFIQLHGTIEVGQVDDINEFAANVLLRVAQYISPKITFYTLQELLAEGKRIDQIFDGPSLKHGFIKDEDLLNSSRKQELHTSAVIREIMDEAQVQAVSVMSVSTGSGTPEEWVLPLDLSKTPKLQVKKTLETLQFVKQGLPTNIDADLVEKLYIAKRDAEQNQKLPIHARDIVLAETKDLELGNYYPVQNQFPANYGVGKSPLPEGSTEKRKAQASQLKGYLTFFEQVLSNYFAQVAHFKDLMSFSSQEGRTYFSQSLLGSIPEFEEVLMSKADYVNYLDEQSGTTTESLARKNKFLNHLLARFSETFTDYAMLLHDTSSSADTPSDQKLITDKCNFLQDYPQLSAGRGNGFNYSEANDIAGLEMRIARKLGVEDYSRRKLGEADSEGFYMVEHILLRHLPAIAEHWDSDLRYLIFTHVINAFSEGVAEGFTRCQVNNHGLEPGDQVEIMGTQHYNGIYTVANLTEDAFEIEAEFIEAEEGGRWRSAEPNDPFSLQLTYLLPAWVERYKSANFKKFAEGTIREETPAHLKCHIKWLSQEEMIAVEAAYFEFLAMLNSK